MKRVASNVAVLLAAGLMAHGAAQATDLLQAYRDAQERDAQFAAARAAVAAGREKLPQGRAGLLPTINLSANTVWNENDITTTTSTTRRYNNHGWTLNLTQPLFRMQNFAQYEQGKLSAGVAEAQFVQAGQDLALRVAQAYFDVLQAEAALTAMRAQKQAISEQLEQAKKNFEVGTSTIVDTHEAQSRFDLATAQEIAAESDLEVKRRALELVTGKPAQGLKGLRDKVQMTAPQPAAMQHWADAAEKGSPLVQAQELQAEVAAREMEKNRAGHYPTLDLVANQGYSKTGYSTIGVPMEMNISNVGFQLSIPLYAGGAVSSRTTEAAALRDKALADLDYARRGAVLAARQAYLGVSNGLAQVKALEQALVSSRSALDSNKLGYEVGVRINIDVLNAQQQLYATQRDLSKARLDTLLAQMKLKAAAGELGEDDVRAVNALLE